MSLGGKIIISVTCNLGRIKHLKFDGKICNKWEPYQRNRVLPSSLEVPLWFLQVTLWCFSGHTLPVGWKVCGAKGTFPTKCGWIHIPSSRLIFRSWHPRVLFSQGSEPVFMAQASIFHETTLLRQTAPVSTKWSQEWPRDMASSFFRGGRV